MLVLRTPGQTSCYIMYMDGGATVRRLVLVHCGPVCARPVDSITRPGKGRRINTVAHRASRIRWQVGMRRAGGRSSGKKTPAAQLIGVRPVTSVGRHPSAGWPWRTSPSGARTPLGGPHRDTGPRARHSVSPVATSTLTELYVVYPGTRLYLFSEWRRRRAEFGGYLTVQ